MLNILKNLVETTNARVLGQVLNSKCNQQLKDYVLSESKELEKVSIKERVYYLLNGKPNFLCNHGSKKTFNAKTNDYGFCHNAKYCACLREYQKENYTPMDMTVVVNKRKETWLKKYGVDNASKCEVVKKKRKETMSQKEYSHIYNRLAKEKLLTGYEQIKDRVKDTAVPLFSYGEYYGSSRKNQYYWKCIKCDHEFNSHIDYGTFPKCPSCYPKTISKAEVEIKNFITSLGIEVETHSQLLGD